jgi:dolichol kinase
MTYGNEVRRKLIHLGASIFPLLYVFVEPPVMAWIAGALVALLLTLDIGRLYSPALNGLASRVLGPVLRGAEARALTGATWMAIAGLICVLAFPKWVAIVAFLFISISDALAALVGRAFGRAAPGKKSYAGSAAFLISALTIALLLLWQHPLAAAIGALVATLAEAVRLRIGRFVVDDNLTIALAGGGAIYALMLVPL